MLNVLLLSAGVAIILVALFLIRTLNRLSGALKALEEMLLTTTEEMRETLPEVREGLGNVNDIAAGVNVALKVTGSGAHRFGLRTGLIARRLGIGLRATLYGVQVGAGSLATSYAEDEESPHTGGLAGGD